MSWYYNDGGKYLNLDHHWRFKFPSYNDPKVTDKATVVENLIDKMQFIDDGNW